MRFLILRLASAVPVLIGISIVSFYLLQLAPGDFLDLMVVQNPHLTPQDIARLREIYGLDQPVYVQYFHWVKGILQGDLGYSRVYAQSVSDLIRQRADHVSRYVSTTDYYANRMAEYLAIPRDRIAVIPTGLSPEFFTPIPARAAPARAVRASGSRTRTACRSVRAPRSSSGRAAAASRRRRSSTPRATRACCPRPRRA